VSSYACSTGCARSLLVVSAVRILLRAFDHFCPRRLGKLLVGGAELRNWPGRDVTGNLVGLLCSSNPGMLA